LYDFDPAPQRFNVKSDFEFSSHPLLGGANLGKLIAVRNRGGLQNKEQEDEECDATKMP
jgi:hypothetical protein